MCRYYRLLVKMVHCRQRKSFLQSCHKNDLIPRFLKFRIPENGCFEPTVVHNFQKRLLRKEMARASQHYAELEESIEVTRRNLREDIPEILLPYILLYDRIEKRRTLEETFISFVMKLSDLAMDQEKTTQGDRKYS